MNESRREPKTPEIGGYVIAGHLGQGGMGDVWKARQDGTNRLVAIKMIRAIDRPDAAQMARFQLEAELISQVQNPHIVQVFHTGSVQGRPYLVMEFVEGGTLADRMRAGPFETAEAVRLIETIARAIGKVHRKGIVHRDLKPANILIDEAGAPKIADFGLARLAREQISEQSLGKALGTPGYMSPEQILGANAIRKVASETDIFAIGVIFYQLLTGRHPFQAQSDYEAKLLACNAEPQPPRSLRRELPRDLEAICLKCLEKNRSRRYEDGIALADDLRRFIEARPIQARPIGRAGRAYRWCLRNPLAAGLIVLTLGGAALAVAYGLETSRRRLAEMQSADRQRRSDENAYFGAVTATDRELTAGRLTRARELLDDAPVAPRDWEWRHLDRRLRSELLRVRTSFSGERVPLAFSPDGSKLVVEPGVEVDVLPSSSLTKQWRHGTGTSFGVFSRDGSLSVTIEPSQNQPIFSKVTHHDLVVWEYGPEIPFNPTLGARREKIRIVDQEMRTIIAACFSPDGKRLAAVNIFGKVGVWDVANGQRLARLELANSFFPNEVATIAFSPDGQTVAALVWSVVMNNINGIPLLAGQSRQLVVWDVKQPQPRFAPLEVEHIEEFLLTMVPNITAADDLVFSHDGGRVAFASSNGTIRLHETATGRAIRPLEGHPPVQRGQQGIKLAFFPDGSRLASGGSDRMLKIWDISTESRETEFIRSPDSYVIPWKGLDARRRPILLPALDAAIAAIAISPDGRRIAATDRWEAKVWDVDRLNGMLVLDVGREGASALAIHPRRPILAVSGWDRTVKLRDLRTGEVIETIAVPEPEAKPGEKFRHDRVHVSALAFSDDGATLAIGTGGDTLAEIAPRIGIFFRDVDRRVWLGSASVDLAIQSLVFGRDGRVYSAVRDGILAWNPKTSTSVGVASPKGFDVTRLMVQPNRSAVFALGYMPERNVLAVRLDLGDGTPSRSRENVVALAFDAQGKWAARAGIAKRIELIDVSAGTVEAQFRFPGIEVQGLALNADGSRLAVWGTEAFSGPGVPSSLSIWDPLAAREVLNLTGFAGRIGHAVFSADGNFLVTREDGGPVRIWDGTPDPAEPKSAGASPTKTKPGDGTLP